MTWAILVINIKGGTGKSTIAQELAYKLRDNGYDIGVLDADIDSANLSSRMGTDERVSFKGDHTVEPVEHDGMKLYSMENAFEDASFSQTGIFMKEVITNMIHHSDWGDLDYMVVDCPPGSSDVFEVLVNSLRANMLGALSVGIPDAVSDTARLVKVCNHNWIPILGFIENMSGMRCHNDNVVCPGGDGPGAHDIKPFGSGDIKEFSKKIDGNYLGDIPLCVEETEISKVAEGTLDNTVNIIEDASRQGGPELPEDNVGDRSFIKNVWGTVKKGLSRMNEEFDIEEIQDEFGVEGRDPIVVKIELTDATGFSSLLSEVILTVDGGDITPLSPRKAKRKGIEVEGGMRITSQDMYDAIRGEKKMMYSPTGEIVTDQYSIMEAVKMGDAEIWGDRTINRLSVLDKILSNVISMDELAEVVAKA